MKRFSLKVSQDLFGLIKKNGTQQSAVDSAVAFILSQKRIVENSSGAKLEKQILFTLSKEDETQLSIPGNSKEL